MAALMAPAAAHAHVVTTGLGPVYDGIVHLLVTPEDLIAILATGILAGLTGPGGGRRVLSTLPAVWMAASLAGYFAASLAPSPVATVSTLLVLGMLLTVGAQLSPCGFSVLAAVIGAIHGVSTGAAVTEAARPLGELFGASIASFVLLGLSAALPIGVQGPWKTLAGRVLGAWIVAFAVLILALTVRG